MSLTSRRLELILMLYKGTVLIAQRTEIASNIKTYPRRMYRENNRCLL